MPRLRSMAASPRSARVVRREAETFPPAGEETLDAGHVVERLDIGQVDSEEAAIRITLIAENEIPIGIDSIVVTRMRNH